MAKLIHLNQLNFSVHTQSGYVSHSIHFLEKFIIELIEWRTRVTWTNCVLLRENVDSLSKNGSHHLRAVDIQLNDFGGESTLSAVHCQKCIIIARFDLIHENKSNKKNIDDNWTAHILMAQGEDNGPAKANE